MVHLHYLDNVMKNNTTANTPTNAYSPVNVAPQLNQNRAEKRTALNKPSNAATTQKQPQSLWDIHKEIENTISMMLN